MLWAAFATVSTQKHFAVRIHKIPLMTTLRSNKNSTHTILHGLKSTKINNKKASRYSLFFFFPKDVNWEEKLSLNSNAFFLRIWSWKLLWPWETFHVASWASGVSLHTKHPFRKPTRSEKRLMQSKLFRWKPLWHPLFRYSHHRSNANN